jgi:hypothetical protein
MANADAFDRLVADRLKESGRKVAYLMVDALRYELGVALEKLLAEDGPVELQAAYAQLPTITLVGMASLLPGRGHNLTLALENDSLVPKLAGASVGNVTQRMEVMRKRLGDRFEEMPLNDFVRGKPKIRRNGGPAGVALNRDRQPTGKQPRDDAGLDSRHAQADSGGAAQVAWHGLQGSGDRD